MTHNRKKDSAVTAADRQESTLVPMLVSGLVLIVLGMIAAVAFS